MNIHLEGVAIRSAEYQEISETSARGGIESGSANHRSGVGALPAGAGSLAREHEVHSGVIRPDNTLFGVHHNASLGEVEERRRDPAHQ
jgi:hypothetical protein